MMPFFSFDDDEFFGDLLLMGAAGGGKAVEATAIGNPLTFVTDLARPLKSLLIPFTPQQEGTGDPSPENIRSILPWNGLKVFGGGKNLLNVTPYGGVFFNVETGTDLAKTTVHATCAIDENEVTVTTDQAWYGCVFATGVLPPGTYNVHTETSQTNCRISSYITDDALIIKERKAITSNNITITLVEPSRIAVVISNSGTGSVVATNVQVESGSAFVAYEPYKPITETDISFTSPVYGGTLDVVSGVLGNGWIPFVFDDQTVFNSGVYDATRDLIGAQINELPSTSQDVLVDACCDKLVRRTNANEEYCFVIAGNGRKYCQIFCGRVSDHPEITTRDEARAFVSNWLQNNPVTLVYSIPTPTEQTLTGHQITALVGDNTIWSDADGSMTAVYLKKG